MPDGHPETAATQFLTRQSIPFKAHLYEYGAVKNERGTAASSRLLGVDEHQVVKTLVMEDEAKKPLIVLMHGDRTVSTKELARQAGRKRIEPCDPEVANRHTGYLVGGTSPFGTKRAMPVYYEASIAELEVMFINGGRRGFLVEVEPRRALAALAAKPVTVAL
ncbi:MAG: aminoacyl-tRNA deacylase [Polyangiaceae bacterium]